MPLYNDQYQYVVFSGLPEAYEQRADLLSRIMEKENSTHCARCGGRLSLTVNLPMTHFWILAFDRSSEARTYALCLQMCAPQAVMVLIEVHHLEAIELVRHFLDLFLLARLNDLHAWSIPSFLSFEFHFRGNVVPLDIVSHVALACGFFVEIQKLVVSVCSHLFTDFACLVMKSRQEAVRYLYSSYIIFPRSSVGPMRLQSLPGSRACGDATVGAFSAA